MKMDLKQATLLCSSSELTNYYKFKSFFKTETTYKFHGVAKNVDRLEESRLWT